MKNNNFSKALKWKIGVLFKVFIILLLFFSGNNFLAGQCELLDLPGVPVDLTLQESYVKTTEQKVVYPSAGEGATLSAYEYARMEPTILIEEVQHASNAESGQVMISSVSNPSEYFTDYVAPYSHVIVEPSDIYIYQNESIIGSYDRSPWSLDSIDLEEGSSDPPLEGENSPYPMISLGGDLIQVDYGDLIYVIDTVQNFEIFNALDSNGQTQSVKFIQRDPTDTSRTVPLFSTNYYKEEKRNGECYYQLIEKTYSHYCRVDPEDSTNVDLRSAETEEKRVGRDLTIYPNPANDFINLQYSSLKDEDLYAANIEVISQTGHVVFQGKASSSRAMRLDVSDYYPGFYIVRIQSKNTTLVNKFVKQ